MNRQPDRLDVRTLGARQLDALREVANIGAGHAATALSRMTGQRIMVDVPEVRVLRLEEVGAMLGDPGEVVTAVTIRLENGLTGRMAHIFPASTVQWLLDQLIGGRAEYPRLDVMARSALAEVANIIVGAYLHVLSDFLALDLTMSVPALQTDMAAAVLVGISVSEASDGSDILLVETRIGVEEGAALPAHFLLMPDAPSLARLLAILRVV